MNELPPGWTGTTTGALLEFVTSGSRGWARYYSDQGAPFIRIGNLRRGSISPDLTVVQRVSPPSGAEGQRTRVMPNDILISITADLGRVALMTDVREAAYINQHVALARPVRGVNAHYLAWYLTSDAVQRQWARLQRGATKLGLGLDDIRLIEVPLPPAPEQERIIAAIEEQFSRLDAGIATLELVRQNLGRMRASVLRGAVIDALECTNQGTTLLADLLSAPLANGKSVPDGPDDGFPVLRLTAVRDGWIDVSCSKKGAWTAEEAKPYVIRKGDYLVVRGNGSKHLLGRGGLVGVDAEVAYPDTLIRLRFDDTLVVSSYVALIWKTAIVRDQIESAARTTAGIYKINQKDLRQIALPVPSIEDQTRIHASANGMLDAIGALEAQLHTQLRRSNALRSSILAAAFSGKLVPQDPNDEPALALLERIAIEGAPPNGKRPKRTRGIQAPEQEITA